MGIFFSRLCLPFDLSYIVEGVAGQVVSESLSSSKKQCVDSSSAVLTTHLILMVDLIRNASGSLPSTLLFHNSNTTALTSHNKLL